MRRMRFEIVSMTCGHCVASVDQALRSVPGVAEAEVVIGSAEVDFDEARCRQSDIVSAVSSAGFSVTGFEGVSD